MSALTNGKWELPEHANGVLAPPAKLSHPHRTEDVVVGATVASVLALPFIVIHTLRENGRRSPRTLRSFLRAHKLSAHRAK